MSDLSRGGPTGGDPDPSVRWLRAVAHPVRLRILSLLTGRPSTAAEVARDLGLTHANASYHLRQLLAAGHVEVAGLERIRGGRATRYRAVPWEENHRGEPPTRRATESGTPGIYAAMADELRRRASEWTASPHNRLTDAEVWLDDDDMTAIGSLIDHAARTLHAGARPPRTPGTRRLSATIAVFELSPDP